MRNWQIKTFFVGIGNIFCQGIDLFYLCHDHQEKRKELASEMESLIQQATDFYDREILRYND